MRHLITANDGFIKYVVMENEPKPDFTHDLLSEFQSNRRRGGADSETYSDRSLDSSLYRTRGHVREIVMGNVVSQPRKFNSLLSRYADPSQRHFPAFLTLTFSDNPVSLRKSTFQKFMKRLRKYLDPLKVRYFMCGEYGEQFSRPHFHVCLFGWSPPDLELISSNNGVPLFSSKIVSDLWGLGFVTVGHVTFESAAYVARYVMKKVTGKSAAQHYEYVDEFGEVIDRLPEYTDMSRRPGIASDWYDLYKRDLEKDFLTLRGVRMRPPRFYDKLLHRHDPDKAQAVKDDRKAKALLHSADNSPARLAVKRSIKERKLTKLKRGLNHEL